MNALTPKQAKKSITRYLPDPDERELEGLLRDLKRALDESRKLNQRLLRWAEYMGGFEGPVWADVQKAAR